MRTVAVHRIYATANHYLLNGVVVFNGKRVVDFFTLTREIEHTEWIGGVIFLSAYDHLDKIIQTSSINEVCQRITFPTKTSTENVYAFHASSIDYETGVFKSDNHWTLLTS